jgi:AbrB family looped-hinge helix DNA binding protein
MQSTITSRGQTVIPAFIRHQFHLSPADRLEWVLDQDGIRVVPVRANPIEAFRGQGRKAGGGATIRLLVERRKDKAHE